MSTWEEEKVSWGKRASYSMIWFLDYIAIAGMTTLIFIYYEVELHLAAFYVGLGLVIFALWNMINDPLIGFLTDKPMRWSKKWGLRMPWILFGGILTVLFYFLIFTVPDIDAKNDPLPVFWYMVIMTCLYDTFYSILTTHAYGGFTNIFRTRDDRRKGGTIGQWMGTLSRFIIIGIIIPYIVVTGDPSSYIKAALVTALIMGISLVFFIPGIHENEAVKTRYLQVWEYLEARKVPYFKFLKITVKQKNYMLNLFAFTMFTISYVFYYVCTLYIVNDVLPWNERTYYGIPVLMAAGIVYTISFMISIFIWSHFVADRLGHANTYALGLILLGISFLAAMWYTTALEYILWHIFGGVGIAAFSSVWMSIAADTYDEVTNACGVHQEASLLGINNFFFRFAYVIVGITVAFTHIVTGYVPGAIEQTEIAKIGIRINIGLIPFLCCLLGALMVLKFYDLKGEKREKLMVSMREKGL